MSRIIQSESAGKLRNHLMRSMTQAIRASIMKNSMDAEAKDMIAFIVICLERISSTIDRSVVAWEKRGYWVKADHFRLEWEWVQKYSGDLRNSLIQENWSEIQSNIDKISMNCKDISHPIRFNGTPWNGAYSLLKRSK